MSTATKLTYLNETKSQLKDMINYGLPTENQITNETTFRNYVKGIFEAFIESLRDSTTLYTNLPKISGNGTQITLNDTAYAPMRITLKASELTQDATPTPDSPQDIHTISGDNSVLVNGKNFARVDDTNISATGYTLTTIKGLITTTTTGTNNSIDLCKGIRTGVYLPNYANANDYHLTPANQETYKLSISNVTADITGTANQIIEIFTNQRQIQLYITPAGSLFGTTSFTLQENEYVKSIYMWTNGVTTINKLQFNIQLEKGSTATTYEPYVSNTQTISLGNIEYCKIGNYEDEFILTSGKNKLDLTDLSYLKSINTTGTWSGNTYTINGITYTINDGGTIKVNGTSTGSAGLFLYGTSANQKTINGKYILLGATTNNITMRILNYTGGYNFLGTNNSATTPTELDLSTYKTGYIEIMVYSGNTINNVLITPMLTDTSITTFEPYGTNQWYLKKNIGKVVLDGSESDWYKDTTKEITQVFRLNNVFSNRLLSNSTYFSNYFANQSGDKEKIAFVDDKLFLGINKTTANSVEKLRTWLSTHNTEIYYILATPTYTQITGTLETQLNNIYKNMLSYKGTTNVSQINNDLPFVLGVSAIQDLE